MATLTLEELAEALAPGQPIAGLDLGTKTIGLSVSDLGRRLATPRPVLKRVKFTQDAEALLAFAGKEKVAAFIIGLPINMDGTEGVRCQSNRAFARNLLRLREIPIAFWDERMSTMAVNRVLVEEADVTRARRAELVDKMAAAWILQGALERLRSVGE